MEIEENRTWKQKLADNAGELAFWGTTCACIVGYFGIVGYAVKKSADLSRGELEMLEKRTEKMEAARQEALASGAQVLPNGDDGFWIIKDGQVSEVA